MNQARQARFAAIESIARRTEPAALMRHALATTQRAIRAAVREQHSDETITALATAMDQLEVAINTAQQRA